MNPFNRSASGASNAYLFHRTDLVLYVEGQEGDRSSIDRFFWIKAFKNWLPGKSVYVKPVGGKRLLRGMARNVVERNLKRTIVAMDRDYDDKSGQIINDHRIVYTMGYSVENDLCNPYSLKHVAEVITRNEPLDAAISTEIDQINVALSSSFGRVAALDYVYYRSGYALERFSIIPGHTRMS